MKTAQFDTMLRENAELLARPPQRPPTHREKFEKDRKRDGYKSLICEGDSWFRNISRWTTIPDWLNQDKLGFEYQFAVLNQAQAGDTAAEIARNISSITRDISKYHPNGFALSAGGNDLLERTSLSRILARRGSATYFNTRELEKFTKALAANIWTITASAELNSSGIPIFWHTYDYPIPSGIGIHLGPFGIVGPWLKPALESKGYRNNDEMRRVIHAVLDEFTKIQKSIIRWISSGSTNSELRPTVHLVNLKGTVPDESNWPDEIHPNSSANRFLARKFKTEINQKLRS